MSFVISLVEFSFFGSAYSSFVALDKSLDFSESLRNRDDDNNNIHSVNVIGYCCRHKVVYINYDCCWDKIGVTTHRKLPQERVHLEALTCGMNSLVRKSYQLRIFMGGLARGLKHEFALRSGWDSDLRELF